MAVVERYDDEAEIPVDSFQVRIAVVRALRGWNYTQAGQACGIPAENWRKWEKFGTKPQNYEEVCRAIARGAHFSKNWISAGGPLQRADCYFTLLHGLEGQVSFDDLGWGWEPDRQFAVVS